MTFDDAVKRMERGEVVYRQNKEELYVIQGGTIISEKERCSNKALRSLFKQQVIILPHIDCYNTLSGTLEVNVRIASTSMWADDWEVYNANDC